MTSLIYPMFATKSFEIQQFTVWCLINVRMILASKRAWNSISVLDAIFMRFLLPLWLHDAPIWASSWHFFHQKCFSKSTWIFDVLSNAISVQFESNLAPTWVPTWGQVIVPHYWYVPKILPNTLPKAVPSGLRAAPSRLKSFKSVAKSQFWEPKWLLEAI